MRFDLALQRVWYESGSPWSAPLLIPLSWLFEGIVALRRLLYRAGVLRSIRVERPVVVVGNITVGGAGKTPFVIWLASQLQARGVRIGIVLRGYGGHSAHWPREVVATTAWWEVGDEAVLLAKRTGAIVVAGPDRVAAARRAIELGAEIVVADDGMQHYRLARQMEIAVVDELRRFGNERLLPAGPLREPRSRLASVDLTVITQRSSRAVAAAIPAGLGKHVVATPGLADAISLTSGERRPLAGFRDRPVHAVAGIGHPQAFFAALTAAGLQVRAHPFPDHAALRREDIVFGDGLPVLMTEKDAVKCAAFADATHWMAPLDLQIVEAEAETVLELVSQLRVDFSRNT
jgi:tetraacyldisaccharide 4'-kinase